MLEGGDGCVRGGRLERSMERGVLGREVLEGELGGDCEMVMVDLGLSPSGVCMERFDGGSQVIGNICS